MQQESAQKSANKADCGIGVLAQTRWFDNKMVSGIAYPKNLDTLLTWRNNTAFSPHNKLDFSF